MSLSGRGGFPASETSPWLNLSLTPTRNRRQPGEWARWPDELARGGREKAARASAHCAADLEGGREFEM
jgi:hypothetical protein